ncbi:hypothetical protein [Psychrobacillus sp. OK028]|uniref:hypothetical protein n=1 Tax=Psychrobacillus sp. OK028 TaxID=1884359 RepID=UPI000B830AE9|nr:hypothetical protein [Psychrobacillus sp. OK028]
MPTLPESIQPSIVYVTFAYQICFFLFVFFRIVVFNFALKKIKRPLSIVYDISLFVITTFWLLYLDLQDFIDLQGFISDPYDSPIFLIAASAYFVSIFDFIYNYFSYKKIKSTNL